MTATHVRDADCLAAGIDPATLACVECGVDHSGPPCDWCGGVGFHEEGCRSPFNDADSLLTFDTWRDAHRQIERIAAEGDGTTRDAALSAPWPWGALVADLPDGTKLQARALIGGGFAIACIQASGSWSLIR